MTFLDLIVGLLVFGFVLAGLWFGLIHMIGAVIGTALGVMLAGRYASMPHTIFGSSNAARVAVFFIVMIVVTRLVGLVFWLFKKAFKFIAIIPGMKSIERLLGAVLGFVEGVIVVGGALYLAARYPLSPAFSDMLSTSKVALWLIKSFGLVAPLLPDIIKNLKSVV